MYSPNQEMQKAIKDFKEVNTPKYECGESLYLISIETTSNYMSVGRSAMRLLGKKVEISGSQVKFQIDYRTGPVKYNCFWLYTCVNPNYKWDDYRSDRTFSIHENDLSNKNTYLDILADQPEWFQHQHPEYEENGTQSVGWTIDLPDGVVSEHKEDSYGDSWSISWGEEDMSCFGSLPETISLNANTVRYHADPHCSFDTPIRHLKEDEVKTYVNLCKDHGILPPEVDINEVWDDKLLRVDLNEKSWDRIFFELLSGRYIVEQPKMVWHMLEYHKAGLDFIVAYTLAHFICYYYDSEHNSLLPYKRNPHTLEFDSTTKRAYQYNLISNIVPPWEIVLHALELVKFLDKNGSSWKKIDTWMLQESIYWNHSKKTQDSLIKIIKPWLQLKNLDYLKTFNPRDASTFNPILGG
jgi:hypothetical protein